VERRTLRLVTRSAVSRSVNWLIWSTMPSIFGFGAAVDCHRAAMSRDGTRDSCCCRQRAQGLVARRKPVKVVYGLLIDILTVVVTEPLRSNFLNHSLSLPNFFCR
jgi:hypothetical protein